MMPLLILAGCQCGASHSVDTGHVDVGVDLARDTWLPFDGGPDTYDMGPDVYDAGPEDPGWVALPGLPEGCVVERASHPEHLLRNEWGGCGPGCEYLVADERYDRGVNRSGWHDGTTGFFSLNQGLAVEDELTRQRILVLATTEGEVLGGWRGPSVSDRPLCMPGTIVIGGGYALLTIIYLSETLSEWRLYYAPLDQLGQRERPTAVFGASVLPAGALIQNGSISSQVAAFELQPAGDLLLVRPDGSFDRQHIAGNPQTPYVVGEHVFVDVWDGPLGRTVTHHAQFGEGNAPFMIEEDAHIAGAVASEDRLTWVQAYGPGRISEATRIELWESPLPIIDGEFSVDALEPRMVRIIAPGLLRGWSSDNFEGSGIWTAGGSKMVRLSDGIAMRFPLGTGAIEGGASAAGDLGALWMAGGERAIRAVLIGDGPRRGTGTVRRDALSGLIVREDLTR